MAHWLIVDDEPSICWGLRRLGEQGGHQVTVVSSAEQALEVRGPAPHVIVLDVRLPGMDGLTAIEHLRRKFGDVPIIVITAYGDLETAVEAVRQGAFDYLLKPFDLAQVQRSLTRALSSSRLVAAVAPADVPELSRGSETVANQELVGRSPAMQQVFKQIALAADSDACVLLAGESGTGKELAARAIHRYSKRSDGPFVAVNVAALSESLSESELFGHVRGAFTGAETDRVGLLVQADRGTLFLDEVADIPLPTQVKLLRALEHGEVVPVGSNTPVRSHFRLVSATHQDLLQRVQENRFRHDLYFRLCAFRIEIPPLRERPEDIQALAEHFLQRTAAAQRGSRPHLSAEALEDLKSRPWYGNVRELRNVIEHGVIVARGGIIEPEHLPPAVSPARMSVTDQEPRNLDESLTDLVARWAELRLAQEDGADDLYEQLLQIVEPPLLKAAHQRHHGQFLNAARRLGLHRTTLRKKMDQYGLIDGED